jgi:hypothetical protein
MVVFVCKRERLVGRFIYIVYTSVGGRVREQDVLINIQNCQIALSMVPHKAALGLSIATLIVLCIGVLLLIAGVVVGMIAVGWCYLTRTVRSPADVALGWITFCCLLIAPPIALIPGSILLSRRRTKSLSLT